MADHCFEALTNKEQWESFAAENKTIADKIKDFIKEFVAMINRAFDKYFVHDNAEIRNEVREKFVDVGSDIKYSVSDIDNYTEEMYDNFGWVKVNDVLSSQALRRMYSQFASINTGVYFDKTPEGYYIIPTGNYNKASNCFVYISGTMEMPVIQKIIKLNLDNETNI